MQERYAKADSIAQAVNAAGPALLFQGEDDSSDLVESATQLRDALQTAAIPASVMPGTPLNQLAAGKGVLALARAFVNGVGPLSFMLTSVSDGTHDLVGFKTDQLTPGADTALLRRDVVVSGDGSVGTVDFTGSEAFAAASATITVGGLLGETPLYQMFYHVGATCQAAGLQLFGSGGATFPAFGIPTNKQRPTDYHRISIVAPGADASRSVSESFHTLADRTVTLGGALPVPTVSSLGGPYKRLQAAYTLPGDYDHSTGFNYVDAAGDKRVSIFASAGYLGGSAVLLALADYASLAGWNNAWAPDPLSTGTTDVVGVGGDFAASACTEGASTKFATRSGTY